MSNWHTCYFDYVDVYANFDFFLFFLVFKSKPHTGPSNRRIVTDEQNPLV